MRGIGIRPDPPLSRMIENRHNPSSGAFGTLAGGAAGSLALSTGCSHRDWEGGINCGKTHRSTACIPQIIHQRNGKKELGSGLRFCDSQSAAKLFVKSYGQVGLEFKLRPFSAGSILTFRNKIEQLRFRIDVGAPANINACISHLAESKSAALEHAHAAAGTAAGEHPVAEELLRCVIPEG